MFPPTPLFSKRGCCAAKKRWRSVCAKQLDAQRDTAAFVEAKLVEMQRRHARRPALVLEPDVKNGSGGLRDLHTMMWLAQVQGLQTGFYALMHRRIITRIEAGLLRSCHRELARLRIDLHLAAGRAEERLVFDLQAEISCRRYPDWNGRRRWKS